jgi:predicted alpha/beta-fold hydrolase
MSLSGHVWTLGAYLYRWLRPQTLPPSEAWSGVVEDSRRGSIRLTGRLNRVESAEGLVVLLHGLGGCADSSYLYPGVKACLAAGLSSLRVNLRGADRQGGDVYHAGLTADLRAAVESEIARSHGRVWVLGYSMGGHIGLRFAVENDGSVAAVAAVCPPIDLQATARVLDSPSRWPYRTYLLRQLSEIYSEVARRHADGPRVEDVAAARSFVEFDSLVVAPRYGFLDAQDYYRQVSVGPMLTRLQVPCLVVAAAEDPMVPAQSLRDATVDRSENLTVVWSSPGGHLAFPRSPKILGDSGADLESQIVGWLRKQ